MADQTTILAIDPGRVKCGVAVVARGLEPQTMHRAVVPADQIGQLAAELCGQYSPDLILIGNGTTASDVAAAVRTLGVPVRIVDESRTSLDARTRYFKQNPPRGLRRLIPASLQSPPAPIDDYVAVILAERYLAQL
jgi:RNase H-fold protein (predicted Holliday junction resolvase)